MIYPWRRALIVGASSGIGAELARQLGSDGCLLALVARREPELAAIASEVRESRRRDLTSGEREEALESPDGVCLYPHDVMHYDEIPALFQQICHDLGGLDLVIYSAGFLPRQTGDEYDFAKDRKAIEVNLLGAVAWLNEAARRFERAGEGTIVGISSVAGDRGRRGNPVYNATKAALNTYLEALYQRLSPRGVAVVTVKPGSVATPMTEGLGKLPLMISASDAARQTLRAAASRRRVAYIPWLWRPIMFIIRLLPARLVPR